MPDEKITELALLAAADIDLDADHLVAVDDSVTTTKRIPAITLQQWIEVALSDESTAIAATADPAFGPWTLPFAFTVNGLPDLSLNGATTTGTFTVDIEIDGVSVLSTTITIDAGEVSSQTAATPPVVSDGSWAKGQTFEAIISGVGDGTATGAKLSIPGIRS